MYYYIILVLILNTLWFVAAFHLFSLKSNSAAKMFLSKPDRIEPYFPILAHLLKFLGGMNFAFAVLSILCLIYYDFFFDSPLAVLILLVMAIAHGSQFWFNLPLAIKERKGNSPLWPVLRNRMYFIFKGDIILAIMNLVAAIGLYY